MYVRTRLPAKKKTKKKQKNSFLSYNSSMSGVPKTDLLLNRTAAAQAVLHKDVTTPAQTEKDSVMTWGTA